MEPAQRILIADDEQDILALYKTKFEREGFTIFTATNGLDVVALAESIQPDLILMDVKMPKIDGIAAQKKIYENEKTNTIPVIFLTAFSDPIASEIDDSFGKERGVIGVIRKGGDLKDLVNTVKKLLAEKR
jgi:CheY-like chemotaxis protein